jgi:thymidylate synthase ThyX
LAEVQQFSQELHKAVEKIAPSLIRNIDLADLEIEREPETYKSAPPPESVKLMRATENADDVFLKALFATCEGVSYEEAESVISEMNITEKSKYLKAKLKGITEHHAFSRAYETVGFAFQLVVSASAYAQLKRHRITTQLPLPYHPDLGHTIPLSIIEAGLENDFREKMKSVERLYREIFPEFHNVAVYALTNAHRRVVYFYCNAREMYHLARLRMDSSAQWDIKTLVGKMVELAQENAPLTMALACGKDGFEEMKKAFLSKRP